MIPRATCRLQFHRDFTFADAERLVPYFARLGVSHIYASPVTMARAGSMHGYDVIDPTRINPEPGGEPAFRSLVGALRRHGLGLVIDIVPNHLGVAGGGNAWWNDVLANGRASAFAHFFDIDWRQPILLPILGDPLPAAIGRGDIRIVPDNGGFLLAVYDTHRLPVRRQDQARIRAGEADLEALLARQHYRLAWWRVANDEINWRRFFTINELAAIRVEDKDVFEATHALYFRLYAEGLIDGVRVDHIDGLTDPAGYCRALRARFDAITRPPDAPGGRAWIVVEKILGANEQPAVGQGIDGTSGYDFMEQVSALLHAPEGAEPLGALWRDISGENAPYAAVELRARQEILAWQFDGQLRDCVTAFMALAGSASETAWMTRGMIRRAIERLLWVFTVYRTYGDGASSPASDTVIREQARQRVVPFIPPGEAPVVDAILAWLEGGAPGDPALGREAVRRFQQLSAPLAAKAVEDTAFYRYGRLLSRNDVGSDPGRFSLSVPEFHKVATTRGVRFPAAMLATATHDHKRGEDVRARLAVLSEIPDIWKDRVTQWESLAPVGDVHPADRYMLYQTLFGAWPEEAGAADERLLSAYAQRLCAWQQKALREAKLRSSWEAPDEVYEQACAAWTKSLLDPAQSLAFLRDMEAFAAWIMAPARANMLVQLALRYTVPGVPDLYQGTECADFSLVDPDNRRPVDYALRQRLLDGGAPDTPGGAKFRLLVRLLRLRREYPALFAHGDYSPLTVEGARAGHVLAFRREHDGHILICAAILRCATALAGTMRHAPPGDWWRDTRILMPAGAARDAATLFAAAPVYVEAQGFPA